MTTESIKTQSNRTIQIRTLFRWARLVAWDVFRALVLIPATTVGALILVFTLLGEKPVSSFLESMYENRDSVGDVAGDGLIARKVCLDVAPKVDTPPAPVCKEWGVKSATMAEAVETEMSGLVAVYIPLTFIGFLILILGSDWSRYESRTKP